MDEQQNNLDDFFKTTKKDFEEKISNSITDKHIISVMEGGKRLRPIMASLCYKACTKGKETSDQYQKALNGFICIELAYTVSIIHEDIIEKSKKRRGRPAFHIKESVDNAILFGHKMLTVGFDIALKQSERFARLYVDTWDDTLSGELSEVDFDKGDIKNSKGINIESQFYNQYLNIITKKSATLFSSACKAGAIEADMSGDILKVFEEYGREIGLACQMANDIVGLTKYNMLNNAIGSFINKFEDRFKSSSSKWKNKKGTIKDSKELKPFFICEIKKHVKRAEELSNMEIIPASKFKIFLNLAPSYIVNNILKEIKMTI